MPRPIQLGCAALLLASAAIAELRIEYPSGGNGCQIVEFPSWALPKHARERYNFWDSHFNYHSEYVFRHVEDSPKNLLLVTVTEETLYKQPPMISPDKYWLNLSEKPRVRQAMPKEWESASPVISIFSGPYQLALDENLPYDYRGRKFGKPGKSWPPQFDVESSAGTWLRLASDTVQEQTTDGVATRALTFVDIYHIPTGKRVVAMSGTLSDWNGIMSPPNIGYFLEDRFYVAAVSENRRKMLICDMNRLVPLL
jgi:hypothetical protein